MWAALIQLYSPSGNLTPRDDTACSPCVCTASGCGQESPKAQDKGPVSGWIGILSRLSPPGDDDLFSCEKVDAVGSMDMEITVERALPTAERKEGKRLGDGHIDSGHPSFDSL